jgi:hypothetical protein
VCGISSIACPTGGRLLTGAGNGAKYGCWPLVGQVAFPTGTIQSIDVLVDVQGSADLTNITVNGVTQVPVVSQVGPPTSKDACKHGGWKTFNHPSFKNQGQCVSYVASHGRKQHNKH